MAAIEPWRDLGQGTEPNLKELLLAPEPRSESLAAPRRPLTRRPLDANVASELPRPDR